MLVDLFNMLNGTHLLLFRVLFGYEDLKTHYQL
jgi:hypothetical protein